MILIHHSIGGRSNNNGSIIMPVTVKTVAMTATIIMEIVSYHFDVVVDYYAYSILLMNLTLFCIILIHLNIHLNNRSFIYIRSFIYTFIHFIQLFIHSLTHSFMYSFILHSCVHSVCYFFSCSFIC